MNIRPMLSLDTFAETAVRPALLLNNLEVGGAQTAVLNLAIGLATLGCTPRVFAWRRGGSLQARFAAAGIDVELPEGNRTGGLHRAQVPGRMQRRMQAGGLNVLHAHMSDSAALAAIAHARFRVATIITHHTTDLIDTVGIDRPVYGWIRRRLLTVCVHGVSHNIAVSRSVAERLVAETGVGWDRVSVIENGLPLPPAERVSAAMARRRDRDCQAGPTIVAVGRLTREKGFDTLIRAMPAILSAHPLASAHIVGDGSHRGALAELVASLGIGAHVFLPGFTQDVAGVLESADVFAAPSHIEGLPMAVIEAMAWGVPVVVSDIPGHRELVEDGVTGLRVPVDASDRFAQAILDAVGRPDRAEQRADRALAIVRRTYSAEVMGQRHIVLYRRVLDEAR